jgi:hypothetical protein
VVVVEDISSAGDADLIAIPNLEVQFFHKPTFQLRLTFKRPNEAESVAGCSSSKAFDRNAPGARDHFWSDFAIARVP